ncbi:hypothetical protein L2E82_11311 [Cichorium intybus]|uniref:Uncharacterized protein n=1 Tax=Cichorium intybus TaxID=13427 RepID=A0ACB9GEY6_CICIN|nr:hypothetical protein L2E82_11311 [Cichorium intybus]
MLEIESQNPFLSIRFLFSFLSRERRRRIFLVISNCKCNSSRAVVRICAGNCRRVTAEEFGWCCSILSICFAEKGRSMLVVNSCLIFSNKEESKRCPGGTRDAEEVVAGQEAAGGRR